MKNYIEQKGIKQVEELTVDINGKQVTIKSLTPTSMMIGGKQYKAIVTARVDGKDGYCNLADKPEIASQLKQIKADNEAAFLARYVGIDELLSAINDRSDYHDAMDRMMDDECNDGVNPPTRPARSVNAMRAMYPIAAAYISILKLSDADPSSEIGYRRRCAGKQALIALEAMDTVTAQDIASILDRAQQEISATPLTID